MNQYLITAYDYTDDDAFNRRINVRQHHLDGVEELRKTGNYIFGGAILNDEEKMIGSVMIMQFNDEEELDNWKKAEPYLTQRVWETVDIKPFKTAPVKA